MAYSPLPAAGSGSATAGLVVRASWGEQARLNFDDHEDRILALEAGTIEALGEVVLSSPSADGDVLVFDTNAGDAGAWTNAPTVPVKLPGQYYSQEFDSGDSGATQTINWNDGNTQRLTLTDDCAITLDNPVAGARRDMAR
jgi:hypothetical protein